MSLKLVSDEPPPAPKKARRQVAAKQVKGVESPATVLLHPVHFNPDNQGAASWWSYDQILIGGIKINGVKEIKEGTRSDVIAYLPTPVPRSWGEREFKVVVEYECEFPGTIFQFRMHYGCGDPSELHRGESGMMNGQTGGKRRMTFPLEEKYLQRNELFRATLEVVRASPKPILVYGVWLEIGV
jgi:hypothetical protein